MVRTTITLKRKYIDIEGRRVTNTQILRGEELQIHKYTNIERIRVAIVLEKEENTQILRGEWLQVVLGKELSVGTVSETSETRRFL